MFQQTSVHHMVDCMSSDYGDSRHENMRKELRYIRKCIEDSKEVEIEKLPTLYLFNVLKEKGKINVLYENDDFFAFEPARDGKPLDLANTADAPMSAIHFLVVPKTRIANGVFCEQMKNFNPIAFLKCAQKAADIFRTTRLQTRLDEINEKALWSDVTKFQCIAYEGTRTEDLQKALKYSEELDYSVHLYPHNTVNDLHVHVWCRKLATVSYDLQVQTNEFKNTPLFVLLNEVNQN